MGTTANAWIPSLEMKRAQVREIYDALRVTRFNELCYTWKAKVLRGWSLAFQLVLAVFATSSPIAGWEVVKRGAVLPKLWIALSSITALLSIVAPILRLDDRLKLSTKLATGYCLLAYDLRQIAAEMERNQALKSKALDLFEATRQRTRELETELAPAPSIKVQRRFQAQVNTEMPVERMYWPS